MQSVLYVNNELDSTVTAYRWNAGHIEEIEAEYERAIKSLVRHDHELPRWIENHRMRMR
jgi:hypothetical protein